MKLIRKLVLLSLAVLAIFVYAFNQWGFSGSTDEYDFYRTYNDSITFHVKGEVYDVGFTDIMFDRGFMLINNKKRDSIWIKLSTSEDLAVYIKFDSMNYHGSKHSVMLMKNVADPDGKMIDLTNMKILSNPVDDTKRFDSTQLFLDRYSVELGRDLR